MRINEIEERLSAIKAEMAVDGADLTALNTEVDALLEERKSIMDEEQKRVALRTKVAEGAGITISKENETMEETRTFAVDSVEYRNAYLKALQGKELDAQERTAVTATGAIPTETLNQIVGKLAENPLINAVDVMHIPGAVSIPVASAVNDAAWVDMGTAATDSADAVTALNLAAYKLIKTVEITADVKAMAISAFEAWLTSQIAKKVEAALDAAILSGNGTGKATGIATTISAATGTFTKAAMSYKDLMKIIGSLPSAYAANASFVLPRSVFYSDVIGMVDANGQRVVCADAQSPAKFNILGYPVIIDDNAVVGNKDNVFFGDLKMYKLNFAKDISVESDESVGFRTGSTVYRGMALCDGKLAVAAAVVRFERSAS